MSSTVPLKLPPKRQQADSLSFWLILLAGSVLLNVAFVLGFQATLQQLEPLELALTPIAVEFMPPVTPNSNRSDRPAIAPSASAPAAPSPPAAPSTALPSTAQAPEPTVDELAIALPDEDSLDRPPSVESPPEEVPKTKRSHPIDSATPQPEPEPPPPTAPPNSTASASPRSAPAPSPTGPVTSGVLLPGVPAVPDPEQNRPAEDQIGRSRPQAVSQNPVPATFQVTVLAIVPSSMANPDSASAIVPPTIQGTTTKTFTSNTGNCLLTPPVLHSFGKSVTLQVAVSETGAINDPIQVEASSGNNSYDALARCVVKEWQFNPATKTDGDQPVTIPSPLSIQVAIAAQKS